MTTGRAALLLVPALALLGAPAIALYDDRPPPAHTGGFGEPSCADCHFDNPLEEPRGEVVLEGLERGYRPGADHALVIRVRHPELRRGGFQLSVRHAGGPLAGERAGSLTAADERVAVTEHRGVEYAGHTGAGADPSHPGASSWTVRWSAPAESCDVVLHLAVNAANGDASQFGDYVYLREWRVAARP